MKSKLKLCVLLAALLLLCALPVLSVKAADILISGECGENLTWTLTEDGILTISGTGPINDSSFDASHFDYTDDIVEVIIEDGVTSVGANAFADCCYITQITIPNSVTSIGTGAFYYCSGLESITLPDSITSIGDEAFYECSSLTQVTLPAGLTSISDTTFSSCSNLASVTIPDGVTSIGAAAFEHCSSLSSIELPDSVTSIGSWAFYECSSLTSVSISAKIECIDYYAFSSCDSLEEIEFRGAAPATFDENAFQDLTLTVRYPSNLPGWTEAVLYDYGAEKVTWVPYTALIDLEGATMTLSNSLSMNFVVDMDLLPEGKYYALIIRYNADYSVKDAVLCEQSEWVVYDEVKNQMYFSYHNIAAKEMADAVDVIVLNADNNSQACNVWRDCPRDYCMRAIRDEEASEAPNAKKLALYVDMLNYGAAAQDYFDYKTDNLANKELTEAQQAYATGDVTAESKQEKPESGYKGGSLTLVNEIRLNFVFYTDVISTDMYAVATYKDHYGKDQSVRIEGSDFKAESSNTLLISVTGMAVADYDQAVTCTVYGADGAVIAATDSVASYILRAKAAEADNPLFDMVLKFGYSAWKALHED